MVRALDVSVTSPAATVDTENRKLLYNGHTCEVWDGSGYLQGYKGSSIDDNKRTAQLAIRLEKTDNLCNQYRNFFCCFVSQTTTIHVICIDDIIDFVYSMVHKEINLSVVLKLKILNICHLFGSS